MISSILFQGLNDIIDTYGSLENIQIITLAPELKNSEEVIKELTKHNIVVSVGTLDEYFV